MKTKKIAGRKVTLQSGQWYIATRPMATRLVTEYPITISNLEDSAVVITGLSYDEANQFLAEFNNGASSFDGRVW